MATESKPVTTPADDSPELAHYKSREKDLIEKAKRLDAHPDTKDHDIAGAKQRHALALKQVRDEIKRLSK